MDAMMRRPLDDEDGDGDEDQVRVFHSSQDDVGEDDEGDDLMRNTSATTTGIDDDETFDSATMAWMDQLERQYQENRAGTNDESLSKRARQQDDALPSSSVSATSGHPPVQPLHSSSHSAAIPRQSEAPSSSTGPVPQFHFSGAKAGMESVDKTRLERIIAEVSKGNPYYEKAAKTDEKVRERALVLKQKASMLTPKDLSVAEIEVGKRVAQLEKTHMDFDSHVFVCVDMDQFFVGVEMRDNPSLKGKPVAVGRTLISTASYEARKYGVRSAMPTFIGRKLCPELVVVGGRMEAYAEASQRAQAVFAEYDSNFSMMSLDEAFLDITAYLGPSVKLSSPEGMERAMAVVQEMREKVTEATRGLTCSAGIAATRMLAKICSEKNKPNGQFVLRSTREEVLQFVRQLPVRKIPGIGKASELQLEVAFGVKTVQDLWDKRMVLNRCCTPAMVDFYLRVPLAATETATPPPGSGGKHTGFFGFVDSGAIDDDLDRKSISIERTFRAIKDTKLLRDKCALLCESLAEEIAEKNVFGRTLTLKLKTDTFEVLTRGETLKSAFGGKHITGAFLFRTVEPLLMKELPICIRLMGLRISNFVPEPPNFDASVYRQPVIDRFLVKGQHREPTTTDDDNLETGEIVVVNPQKMAAMDRFVVMKRTADAKSPKCDDEADPSKCPICAKTFVALKCAGSNDAINAHIDACLNRDVISDLVSLSPSSTLPLQSSASSSCSDKSKIESYFAGTKHKSKQKEEHQHVFEDDDDEVIEIL